MLNFLTRVFGTQHERDVKKLQPLVEEINKHESTLKKLSDTELKAHTPKFREQLEKGQSLEELLPPVFAVCREASRRVLGLRHYDVQLIGGIVLHRGQIAEMKTGEGKTLVATLPVYLNALTGKGVHIVTVNDYLAQRDRGWMGQVYHFLGLTTGAIVHDLSDSERQKAYGADVTYGTNNEFGFDYLRDNMKYSLSSCVQKELNYAIVDECDSILVDEARTPLIISGPQERSTDKYYQVKKIIPHLKLEVHFTIEEKSRTASITEEGNNKIEELLGIENLYDIKHIEQLHHIYQSLKAHYLYKKDVDYMVKDDEVIIVDEFTGRLMPGRRWSEGLHQAVEAKEGVKVKMENQTLSTITFQNYFRMYNKLAGMTGTAETEAVEFSKIYSLDVKVIPTHEPICRTDQNDVVYKTEQIKYKKIAELIRECHSHHQPVLVGTVNIEKSERLSHLLQKERISHKVLNAKHHEQEAEIVAQAGRKGAITIATNMAGRGTDIILGGNPVFLAGKSMKNADKDTEADEERLQKFRELCAKEREEVVKAGGLFIIGTERHESRRIDNQLRGRSGRQGDPGGSCFYLSMEDDLMRVFGGERMKNIMSTLRMDEEVPITDRMLTRVIANAQKKVEAHNFEIRKQLLEYDDVMNQQRKAIYSLRRQVMKGENLEQVFRDKLSDVISDLLDQFADENQRREEWNLPALSSSLKQFFNLEMNFPPLETVTAETITEQVQEVVGKHFETKKQELGEHFEPLIQYVLLQTIDARWMEHLSNIDHLREGINLRAYAQKDPLVEYKKESFKMFEKVSLSVAAETVEKIFKVRLNVEPELEMPKEQSRELIYNEDSQVSGFAMKPMPSGPSQTGTRSHQLNREQRRRQKKLKKQRIKI